MKFEQFELLLKDICNRAMLAYLQGGKDVFDSFVDNEARELALKIYRMPVRLCDLNKFIHDEKLYIQVECDDWIQCEPEYIPFEIHDCIVQTLYPVNNTIHVFAKRE